MPDRAKMYIAALDDEAYYKKKLVSYDFIEELLEQRPWSQDDLHQEVDLV